MPKPATAGAGPDPSPGRVTLDGRLDHAAPQLAHLGAQAGDHLTEEPAHEEHRARDHADLDEIEERAISEAGEDADPDRDESREHAEPEERRAHHAEEEERLPGEAQLEPHREHVEHADGNAADAE